MADRLSKFGESVGNAAESSSGAERQSLRVAQRVLQSMTPALTTYEAAFKELQTAGFARPETLRYSRSYRRPSCRGEKVR
jgi:hypothetical protein